MGLLLGKLHRLALPNTYMRLLCNEPANEWNAVQGSDRSAKNIWYGAHNGTSIRAQSFLQNIF